MIKFNSANRMAAIIKKSTERMARDLGKEAARQFIASAQEADSTSDAESAFETAFTEELATAGFPTDEVAPVVNVAVQAAAPVVNVEAHVVQPLIPALVLKSA